MKKLVTCQPFTSPSPSPSSLPTHTYTLALAHMVTYDRATSLPIGRVVDMAVRRYSREMGEYIRTLYNRVKGEGRREGGRE